MKFNKNKEELKVEDLEFVIYLREEEIRKRIKKVARQITKDHASNNPILLVILNGAFMYAADLVRYLDFKCEVHFVKLSSYEGMQSSGNVKELLSHPESIEGRHVIIVEDIIDTGNTLHAYLPKLQKENPASLSITCLLAKKEAHLHDIHIEYEGFSIPNKFVIGYGLDYNEIGRNIKDIYRLKE